MTIHLAVRGWARSKGEYVPIGIPPADTWWSGYKQWWSDQLPAVMIRSTDRGWSALIHGVESSRRDASGRRPAYMLVFEGAHGDGDADLLLRLLGTWLPGYRRGDAAGPVSVALDDTLTGERVEVLRATGGQAAGEKAENLVRDALADERVLAAHAEPGRATTSSPQPTSESWYGDFADARAQQAFLARVHDLVTGRPGAAFWLNQVPGADQAWDIASQAGGDAAILILEPDQPISGLVPITAKKDKGPLQAGPSRTITANQDPPPIPLARLAQLVLLAVAIVLVIGIVFWVISKK